MVACLNFDVPDTAVRGRADRAAPFRDGSLRRRASFARRLYLQIEPRLFPAFAFGFECCLLARLGDFGFPPDPLKKYPVIAEPELFFRDFRMIFSVQKV